VRMYRGWLSRRGFTWEIAAEEVVNGEVLRVVFEVEGAGVMRTLEMEQGLHRRKRLDGSSARVNVDLIPRRESEPTRVPADMRVTDARRSTGEYVERIGARLRLKVPARGIEVTLRGVDRPTLTLLGDDLLGYMGAPAPVRETARTYGVIGGTARDPRTRASSSAIKDVLRGNLETFLRAWEVHA
jgi:hypothetical protein